MKMLMKILNPFHLVFSLVLLALFEPDFANANKMAAPPANSIPFKLTNHAGSLIELFWIDAYKPGENLVKQTSKPLRNNSAASINSYNTHKFRVKFLDGAPPKSEAYADFIKGPSAEEVIVTYDSKTNQLKAKVSTKFAKLVESISDGVEDCKHLPRGDDLDKCLFKFIKSEITEMDVSRTRLSTYRDLLSGKLRNYTCQDTSLSTSEPIRKEMYASQVDGGKKLEVQHLLELDTAKIWFIEDFISDDECDVLMKHGNGKLTRATVASEDGSSIVSESRKANQAIYTSQRNPQDPLYKLYHRVFDYANRVTGFNLHPDGQEDFTIIQYNPSDEYTPHCDGSCDGSMHLTTGRVASSVLYCKVADVGGSTTFTKADIYVKPKKGMAVFFSYKGKDGKMDEGYTEHSGCPVIEGEKWITTVWMRDGVTLQDPWQMYDPNGIRNNV